MSHRYRFLVEVEADSIAEASTVLDHRLSHDDDDLGFSYLIWGWEFKEVTDTED